MSSEIFTVIFTKAVSTKFMSYFYLLVQVEFLLSIGGLQSLNDDQIVRVLTFG